MQKWLEEKVTKGQFTANEDYTLKEIAGGKSFNIDFSPLQQHLEEAMAGDETPGKKRKLDQSSVNDASELEEDIEKMQDQKEGMIFHKPSREKVI